MEFSFLFPFLTPKKILLYLLATAPGIKNKEYIWWLEQLDLMKIMLPTKKGTLFQELSFSNIGLK